MAEDQRGYPGKKLGRARQGLLASNGRVSSFGYTSSAIRHDNHPAMTVKVYELPQFRAWEKGPLLLCQHMKDFVTKDGYTQSEINCFKRASLFYIVINLSGGWGFLNFCSSHPFKTDLEHRKVDQEEFLALQEVYQVMNS